MTHYNVEIYYTVNNENFENRKRIINEFSNTLFIGTTFNGILAGYPHEGHIKVILKKETVSEAEAYLRTETEALNFITDNTNLTFSHIDIKPRREIE